MTNIFFPIYLVNTLYFQFKIKINSYIIFYTLWISYTQPLHINTFTHNRETMNKSH